MIYISKALNITMKKKAFTTGISGFVASLGNTAFLGMLTYGFQKFLVDLPPELKTVIFWLGLVMTSFVFAYAIFRLSYGKQINFILFAGSAFLGVALMVLMSPLLPSVFPYNPLEIGQPAALEAGGEMEFPWMSALTVLVLIIALTIAFKLQKPEKRR